MKDYITRLLGITCVSILLFSCTKTKYEDYSFRVSNDDYGYFTGYPLSFMYERPFGARSYYGPLPTPKDKFSWNFGDGNTSSKHEPTHVYTKQGDYEVTLVVNGNPSANAKYIIHVRDLPDISVLSFAAGMMDWHGTIDEQTLSNGKYIDTTYAAADHFEIQLIDNKTLLCKGLTYKLTDINPPVYKFTNFTSAQNSTFNYLELEVNAKIISYSSYLPHSSGFGYVRANLTTH